MSCNPAIGGLAKGHLVKEIDALGGEMAKATDQTGIQFRQLNNAKGPAVRSSRAQVDRQQYRLRMKRVVEDQGHLSIKQATVEEILVEGNRVTGVRTHLDETIAATAVILAPGTFLNGLVHIGLTHFPSGRVGDPPSVGLSESLRGLGFRIGRLKTGTTPRLNGHAIDFSKLTPQHGDEHPLPFSFSTEKIETEQVPCHITYTNSKTHEIIRSGLDRSPLYCGVIKGVGRDTAPRSKTRSFASLTRSDTRSSSNQTVAKPPRFIRMGFQRASPWTFRSGCSDPSRVSRKWRSFARAMPSSMTLWIRRS